MAYTNVQSGEIPEGTQYYSGKLPLGDYNFYLKIDATGVSPQIVAQCESPDGTMRTAASRTWPSGTQVLGWSVEANETEASVYAKIKKPKVGPDLPKFSYNYGSCSGITYLDDTLTLMGSFYFSTFFLNDSYNAFIASDSSIPSHPDISWSGSVTTRWNNTRDRYYYTYDGKTAYYATIVNNNGTLTFFKSSDVANSQLSFSDRGKMAWIMVYGSQGDEKEEDVLVARFAIDIGDAGGYPGGGGGWTQPGDWNPDPSTTLHLTVNGALSGRHNDPLNDPSYSYVPAENTAQAGYGCGGDGGNGGGGGGGASTIIVRQFATNKANSKEILALAKRHGYGSGGGKGGKGGDGCILIYY